MLPWKVFIRSVGVATLLATAGLAAGQDVLPFSHVSRSTSPEVEEPAPVVDETPIVEAPVEEIDAPDVVDEVDPAEEEVVEVFEAPEAEAPEAPEAAAPVQDDAAPVEAKARPEHVRVMKVRGDHNCDGNPDNGWHRTDFAHPATGEKCTPGESAAKPAAAEAKNGGRPESAPGQVKNGGRPESAPGQVKNGGRPESAPGQVKKAERTPLGRTAATSC